MVSAFECNLCIYYQLPQFSSFERWKRYAPCIQTCIGACCSRSLCWTVGSWGDTDWNICARRHTLGGSRICEWHRTSDKCYGFVVDWPWTRVQVRPTSFELALLADTNLCSMGSGVAGFNHGSRVGCSFYWVSIDGSIRQRSISGLGLLLQRLCISNVTLICVS